MERRNVLIAAGSAMVAAIADRLAGVIAGLRRAEVSVRVPPIVA